VDSNGQATIPSGLRRESSGGCIRDILFTEQYDEIYCSIQKMGYTFFEGLSVLFREKHIRKILLGQKMMIPKIGRLHNLMRTSIQRSWYDWSDIEIEIIKRYPKKLGEISPEDVCKKGYTSLEEFTATWIKIHEKWNPKLEVWVYEFELV